MRTLLMRSAAPRKMQTHACTACVPVCIYISVPGMTTTHHCQLLVLTRPHTQVSLVHHTNTNPPHPVAQPLPPSTEDTPSHCAIIPSFTEHRSVPQDEKRMAGEWRAQQGSARGLACAPPPPLPSCPLRPMALHPRPTCRVLPDCNTGASSWHAIAGSRLCRLRAWERRLPMSSTCHIASSLKVCTG